MAQILPSDGLFKIHGALVADLAASKLQLQIRRGVYTLQDALDADEVFVMSTTRGVSHSSDTHRQNQNTTIVNASTTAYACESTLETIKLSVSIERA